MALIGVAMRETMPAPAIMPVVVNQRTNQPTNQRGELHSYLLLVEAHTRSREKKTERSEKSNEAETLERERKNKTKGREGRKRQEGKREKKGKA